MGHLIQVSYHVHLATYSHHELYSQDILYTQRKDKELNTKLLDYLRKFFKKDHKVFNEIGILR